MTTPDDIISTWHSSCLHKEESLHQLSPYIGKMKSCIASYLIKKYTKESELVFDPFCGSGTIALESLLLKRNVISSDINPYAITLTRGKLFAPQTQKEAIAQADEILKCNFRSYKINQDDIPEWVKTFFHPKTLKEIIIYFKYFSKRKNYFILSCLLGILHHQRPGFLSYPSSHLVPYLRNKKYPKDTYPELYEYRDVHSRLIKKIERAYKRSPGIMPALFRSCHRSDIKNIKLNVQVDAVITSPPYMNALDYARDNRLRLWFLGEQDHVKYDAPIRKINNFISMMDCCLYKINTYLKSEGRCVFVIGDVTRNNRARNPAMQFIEEILPKHKEYHLINVSEDIVPDVRKSRRDTKATKKEWIIAFKKKA